MSRAERQSGNGVSLRLLSALLPVLGCCLLNPACGSSAVDYSRFLARHDLRWERTPSSWFEAPFLGNGILGTMVYQDGPHAVRLEVGRGDVYDHRKEDGAWHNRCRLPVGYFTLETVGTIRSLTGRLSLWDAEFGGEVATDKGSIRLRALVHATRMVMLFDVTVSGGEQDCRFVWHPAEAVAPARSWAIEKLRSDPGDSLARQWAEMSYAANPPSQAGREGAIEFCYQPLLEGGETATAWQPARWGRGNQRLCVSVAHTYPQAGARDTALAAVRDATQAGYASLIRTHRDWWHAYYPASFVAIPDTYWEGFYWIQMYKLASATRADGPLIDTMGPWFQPTVWPCVWFNLNVQLTYSCVADANRLAMGESLIGRLDRYGDHLVANMPREFAGECAGLYTTVPQDLTSPWSRQSLGDLPWAMHDYWMMLRRSMDTRRMREQFFPLLKQTINTYLRLVKEGTDQRLHIESAFSPEYGYAPDTNYNLALLRWGCETLVALCARFHIDDPLLPRWKEILANLTDYPTDAHGFMVGAGMPFDKGHRHYSHLLMAYPLYQVNVEQPGGRELIDKSLRHWMSFKEDKAGYTWTGAAALAAALGEGDRALDYLNGLKTQGLSTTTMYREAEGFPVTETPFSAVQSIHGMLLQSWGGRIRVFPAVPAAWADATFVDLRAEGGFLVSAARREGQTLWLRIQSLAGEPCRIQTDMLQPVLAKPSLGKLRQVSPHLYDVDLPRGEQVILRPLAAKKSSAFNPIAASARGESRFGLVQEKK